MSEIGKNLIKNPVGTNTKKKTFNIGDFKKFKYMKNIESRYSFGKVLGQGAFGLVRYCTLKASGKEFAIKIMTKK